MKRPVSVLLLCGLYLFFALIILSLQPYLGVWLSNRYGIVIFPYSVLHIFFAVVFSVLAYGLFVGNVWASSDSPCFKSPKRETIFQVTKLF